MRMGRTIPPAAAPLETKDLLYGLRGWFRGKQEVARFIDELKQYFRVKHCFAVSSGKAALTLLLRALQRIRPERDRVLMPAFVCHSVPAAVVRGGLRVELCDIEAETLAYDTDKLKQKLTGPGSERLLAIIIPYLYGLPADVPGICELVKGRDIFIVEDAAQAMGYQVRGMMAGTIGDAGFFSLGRGKALSTEEGGIVVTDDDRVAEALGNLYRGLPGYTAVQTLRLVVSSVFVFVFGRPGLFWFPKMLPFLKIGNTFFDPSFPLRAFSSFQAGLARNWRARLQHHNRLRKQNAEWFRLKLGNQGIRYPSPQGTGNGYVPVVPRYPIRVTDRRLWKALIQRSEQEGLGIMWTYPTAVNEIPALHSSFSEQSFPEGERVTRQLLTLPVHPMLTRPDREKIVSELCRNGLMQAPKNP